MHLGNGAITPECVALTLSAAGAGVGWCAFSARREATSVSKLGLAAGLGAFIFAAQAVNVPILPGISAHLVGGVLLAWAVGPALGALTMALVLTIQALLLGDGGTLALGANVINMALVPAGLVALARQLRWLEGENLRAASSDLPVIAALSGAAVVAAAALIAAEVALFRAGGELAGWTAFAQRLLAVHLAIAAAEGAAAASIAAALVWLGLPSRSSPLRPALVAAALALLAALAIPLSSQLPDGYEHAAERSGVFERHSDL